MINMKASISENQAKRFPMAKGNSPWLMEMSMKATGEMAGCWAKTKSPMPMEMSMKVDSIKVIFMARVYIPMRMEEKRYGIMTLVN